MANKIAVVVRLTGLGDRSVTLDVVESEYHKILRGQTIPDLPIEAFLLQSVDLGHCILNTWLHSSGKLQTEVEEYETPETDPDDL